MCSCLRSRLWPGGGGCSRVDNKPTPPRSEDSVSRSALLDLSPYPVGRGYDRGLNQVRSECFERKSPTTVPVNEWNASGFSLFKSYETKFKIQNATKVGVKVEGVESTFGLSTSREVGTSGESELYVALARFTSHTESAGSVTGAVQPLCAALPNFSTNGLEDFVSGCGTDFLDTKTYGGHVLIAFRRDRTRQSVSESIATSLGAKTPEATINISNNLTQLVNMGLSDEEFLLETSGMPFPPTPETLPDGGSAFTVRSTLAYINAVADAGIARFAQVTDYSLRPFDTSEMNVCLDKAIPRRQVRMTQADWQCIHGEIVAVADLRDGWGERRASDELFEEYKLAVDEYLPDNRLEFATVPQETCPIDADGDPVLEVSGPCQQGRLVNAVNTWSTCTTLATTGLADCRANVLGLVNTCADYVAKSCGIPSTTLPSGAVVSCSEEGLEAVRASVIGYTVRPPLQPPPPTGTFRPVRKFDVSDTVSAAGQFFEIPNSKDDYCAMTGISGALHEARAWVRPGSSGNWIVSVISPNQDPFSRVKLEVSCVRAENFFFLNGGSALPVIPEFPIADLANGGNPSSIPFANPGFPVLLGFDWYYEEPQTRVGVLGPFPLGPSKTEVRDLFPLVSVEPVVGAYFVSANPNGSGVQVGGTAVFGRDFGSDQATNGWPTRDLTQAAVFLQSTPRDAFCYLVEVGGRFFNQNDAVRISTSDGSNRIISDTIVNGRDRNPFGRAQCLKYDAP